MFSKLFRHTDLLGKSLDATWQRQTVISQNIANNDTPGYKTQHVEFETAFQSALAGETHFTAARTHEKHYAFGASDPLDVEPMVIRNTNTTMRMDGNNVDVEYEMNELAKNTIQYNMLITKVNKELGRLKYAVREGR